MTLRLNRTEHKIEIIAGIEGNRKAVIQRARDLNMSVMLSANSIFNGVKFSEAWRDLDGLKVHLDSGGFVAMKKYGGFRFSPEQYVTLAKDMLPYWWAQMDYCCEPEIALNRKEVFRRIEETAKNLHVCKALADEYGATQPIMVLQGWKPNDYVSGPAFEDRNFPWPSLVGVGSVCRRHLNGEDGLFAVINTIDRVLPKHVKLHLFGVKSQAISELNWNRRIASADSMAWALRSRIQAREDKVSCTNEYRANTFENWFIKQERRACPVVRQNEMF